MADRYSARAAILALVFLALSQQLLRMSLPEAFASVSGSVTSSQLTSGCRLLALRRAAAASRALQIPARATGVIYSTQTGNTEEVAGLIANKVGVDAIAVDDLSAADLESYDGLIVGCPTWNTGADEYRSGTAWDDLIDEVKELGLSGKPVAVFGCGDSVAYGDNFCDGIEELHETFAAAGAKMMGYVDSSGYQHEESKSVRDGKFLGLPLDQDNEADQSEERIEEWVSQLKVEGMPL